MTEFKAAARRGTGRSVMAALLATTALTLASVARSQDATWLATPGSNDLAAGGNWSGSTVPTGTATFGASSTTSLVLSSPMSLGGLSFTSDAPAYSLSRPNPAVYSPLTLTGAGLQAAAGSGFTLGNQTTINFQNSASTGGITINNMAAPPGGVSGELIFRGSSTASSSLIQNSGFIQFQNSSTASNATINNLGWGAWIWFQDSSSAGSATINGDANSRMWFEYDSSLGSARITTSGDLHVRGQATAANATLDLSGDTEFGGTASAGSATITNRLNGYLRFSWDSTAANATITNLGSMRFELNASTGTATIDNHSDLTFRTTNAGAGVVNNTGRIYVSGSNIIALGLGQVTINNSGTGRVEFFGASSAQNATIVNNDRGLVSFYTNASAGSASITNNSDLSFRESSTAGSATIVNSSSMSFGGTASAGTAQITNNAGGLLVFDAASTAGSASITNHGMLTIQGLSTGTATIDTSGRMHVATTDTAGAATVTVQSGGQLSGHGGIGHTSVRSGGTLLSSSGNLVVNGNLSLASGSIYRFARNPLAGAGSTSVSGVATLGGAALEFTQASFQAQSHTLLTAAGGVSGTFTLDSFHSGLGSLVYSPTGVVLNINGYRASSALGFAGGTNARNVAASLDRVIDGAGGAPPSSFNPLLNLYGPALARQLGAISGEAGTGAVSSGLSGASTFLGIMLDPMGGSRGGTAAAPGSSLIEMADMGIARTPAARVEAAWSIWTRSYGQAGRTASDAAAGAAGTASSIYGIAAGADRLVAPNLLVGFAIAGGGTAFGLSALGSGTGDFAQMGAYASIRLGPAYVSAALAYGWNRFDVTRTVAALGVTETYRSGPVGHTFGGRIEAGRRLGLGRIGVTPYAAAEAIAYAAPGYRESWTAPATGAFALAYSGRATGTLRGELGARADARVASAGTGDLIAFSRLAYGVQTSTWSTAQVQFQTIAGSTFAVFGARASTHSALATLGVEARFRQGLAASLALDGEVGDRHRLLRGSVALRQSW